MNRTSKDFALFIILIIAISNLSLIVKPAFAQSIPKPSVPEFTITLVGPPYTVNTTYSLDPNTGQIVAKIGYYNQYSYIVLTIKNQPFTPFNDSKGNQISFYYNVQTKGHDLSGNFVQLYNTYNGGNYPTQRTESDYTNISLPVGEMSATSLVDYQVQAMIGYIQPQFKSGLLSGYVFVGQTSDWSSTQTLSIPASTPLTSTSPSATLSPTPYVVEFPATIALTFLAVTALAVAVVSRRKHLTGS
jgi:hypothetical protein